MVKDAEANAEEDKEKREALKRAKTRRKALSTLRKNPWELGDKVEAAEDKEAAEAAIAGSESRRAMMRKSLPRPISM